MSSTGALAYQLLRASACRCSLFLGFGRSRYRLIDQLYLTGRRQKGGGHTMILVQICPEDTSTLFVLYRVKQFARVR